MRARCTTSMRTSGTRSAKDLTLITSNPICTSYCVLPQFVPIIPHSSALFLIKELDALGAQKGVRRLGRLILGRLVASAKGLRGLQMRLSLLHKGSDTAAPLVRYISIKTLGEWIGNAQGMMFPIELK